MRSVPIDLRRRNFRPGGPQTNQYSQPTSQDR
jgi:hypothetical protein